DAAVVVMLRVENPFGHAAREMCIATVGIEIGRVTSRPTTSLSARVHDEVGITRTCPEQPVNGKTASAAVADIFHNTGKFPCALTWQNQPAFDGLSTKAIECDIESILRDE